VIVVPFLANLKFPAMVYVVVMGATTLVLVAWKARGRLREATAVMAAAAAALTLIEGINPYLTNTIAHGHPAYPAAGPDALPQAVHFDPAFAAQPRLVQVVRALMSQSSDQDEQPPRLKFPLSVHRSEIAAFGTVDTRIGGLGPLFGGALLIAGALVAFAAVKRRPGALVLALVTLGIFLSTLTIPFGYYSRYAPQLWLAAIPALLTDELRGAATRALATLLVVNTLLVAGASLGTQLFMERAHREQLRALANDASGSPVTFGYTDHEPFVNIDLHFDRYHIAHAYADSLACEHPAKLVSANVVVCLAAGRSPAAAPDLEQRAASLLSFLRR